jgi:hypothetical protein
MLVSGQLEIGVVLCEKETLRVGEGKFIWSRRYALAASLRARKGRQKVKS